MSATTSNSPIPHINLLCHIPRDKAAFLAAASRHNLPASISITHHDYSLLQLPSTVKFDTIVSPANSYGRLDGAFDDAISRALSPIDDYDALTHVAQDALYTRWRGFAPPGTCTLVSIPEEFAERSRKGRGWGCKRVALCPTMRRPANVVWDREVVYECVWSLLCAISNHNRDVRAARAARNAEHSVTAEGEEGEEEIESVLMTPLATGVGRVDPEVWARQCVLAMKHFVEAEERPEKWSRLEWGDLESAFEAEQTWNPNARS